MKKINITKVGLNLEITFTQGERERTFVFSSLSENLGFTLTPAVIMDHYMSQGAYNLEQLDGLFMGRERI